MEGMRRWKGILAVVGIAVLFALVETVQTYLRRYVSWGRDPFGLMFVLMLTPWLSYAALLPWSTLRKCMSERLAAWNSRAVLGPGHRSSLDDSAPRNCWGCSSPRHR